jgi:hypothetical protein
MGLIFVSGVQGNKERDFLEKLKLKVYLHVLIEDNLGIIAHEILICPSIISNHAFGEFWAD